MQLLLSEPQIVSSVKNNNLCLKGLLSVSQELIPRKFLSECLVCVINIMRTTQNFIFFARESIPCCFNNFQGKEFNPNKSIKFIFEEYPWHEGLSIFPISDISTCDWCGGRDGGCNSLDCYTCDSLWHQFLFSSAIFLRDITRCETPGMYKWVPGLSGWDGSAVYLPFILQLTRPLKLCRLLTLGDWKLWPLRVGLALKANETGGGSAVLCILAQGGQMWAPWGQGPFLSCSWPTS